MKLKKLIAELQSIAKITPNGGEQEVRLKTTRQVSDIDLLVTVWKIDEISSMPKNEKGELATLIMSELGGE